MKKLKPKYIVGIDEVGRGPLAGPVAVGAVLIYAEHYQRVTKLFPVVKDSKKLTARTREEWFMRIREAEELGFLVSAVSFVTPGIIDKKGLTLSIRTALTKTLIVVTSRKGGPSCSAKSISRKDRPSFFRILLDGGLKAPVQYENQETIIKGDEKELVIALASIVAKVTRDARMIKLGKRFPAYGFEKHKGYGTRAHYTAIKKHGITPHHRKSFLKGIVK